MTVGASDLLAMRERIRRPTVKLDRPPQRPTQPPPAAPVRRWLDPEVVAEAAGLLRTLADATRELTDALDVAGYPRRERASDTARLSALASGLPPVTLADLVEALEHLAGQSGPAALLSDAETILSLPDEARELSHLVGPLVAVAAGKSLPRHAGSRIPASRITFSISQAPVRAALADVGGTLRRLEALPIARPELTTLRRRRSRRAEPSRAAAGILLGALLLGILAVLAIVLVSLTAAPVVPR